MISAINPNINATSVSYVSSAITGTNHTNIIDCTTDPAGTQLYITDLLVTNASSSTGTWVEVYNYVGSVYTVMWKGWAGKDGGFNQPFTKPLLIGTPGMVTIKCSAAANVVVSINAFKFKQ